jgi:hypothetical protein
LFCVVCLLYKILVDVFGGWEVLLPVFVFSVCC